MLVNTNLRVDYSVKNPVNVSRYKLHCSSKILPLKYHKKYFLLTFTYCFRETGNICIGSSHWLRPPKRQFCVGNTNMLVSNNPCGPNAKPDRPNTKPGKPNASRWYMGCVASPGIGSSQWACTFHVVCINFICVRYPTQTHF